jgi:hypothetical protein
MQGQGELLQNALTALLVTKVAQLVYGPRSGKKRFESAQKHSILFSTGFRLVLETTQRPSIQWVTEMGGGGGVRAEKRRI